MKNCAYKQARTRYNTTEVRKWLRNGNKPIVQKSFNQLCLCCLQCDQVLHCKRETALVQMIYHLKKCKERRSSHWTSTTDIYQLFIPLNLRMLIHVHNYQ